MPKDFQPLTLQEAHDIVLQQEAQEKQARKLLEEERHVERGIRTCPEVYNPERCNGFPLPRCTDGSYTGCKKYKRLNPNSQTTIPIEQIQADPNELGSSLMTGYDYERIEEITVPNASLEGALGLGGTKKEERIDGFSRGSFLITEQE